jgi:rRNA maturation RNase YbeY
MAKPRRQPLGHISVTSTQRRLRISADRIRRLVEFVAKNERRPIDQLDILIVGRRRMTTLNAQLLHHRGCTDVISLDLGDGPTGGLCGQIVVCADVAIAQARLRGQPAWKELLLYITHGLLHVMGYDDQTEAQGRRMHRREDQLLEEFGAGPIYAGAFLGRPARRPSRLSITLAKNARSRNRSARG